MINCIFTWNFLCATLVNRVKLTSLLFAVTGIKAMVITFVYVCSASVWNIYEKIVRMMCFLNKKLMEPNWDKMERFKFYRGFYYKDGQYNYKSSQPTCTSSYCNHAACIHPHLGSKWQKFLLVDFFEFLKN